MPIQSRVLQKWDDIHQYNQPGWLYRGQRSTDWPLRTSLDRSCERHGIQPDRVRNLEERLLREFRRAYHHYSQHIPEREDVIEWLSLMQHYGAPTRLIDFTYSIYIAAYFAAEEDDGDGAIWAINGRWAVEESKSLFKAAGKQDKDTKDMDRLFDENYKDAVSRIFFLEPYVLAVYPINAFRLNQRLLIQRGVFLIPGNVSKSLMQNLEAHPQYDDPEHIIKIVIPKAMKRNALKQLWNMNISRATLFPGLDGYARSLGVYHYAYDPIW